MDARIYPCIPLPQNSEVISLVRLLVVLYSDTEVEKGCKVYAVFCTATADTDEAADHSYRAAIPDR